MKDETPHRSYLTTLLGCRCPRCREGKLFKYPLTFHFKRNVEMYDKCPVCEQLTDIEVGFYYGTAYISYVIALLFTLVSFGLWFITIGFSFTDKRFLIWIIFNSVVLIGLQPWLMRFSRILWLSWFVKYDPEWKYNKPEDLGRRIESEMNNW